jgi:hypothetical protein
VRPTRILHTVPINLPRSARSEAEVKKIRDELARL